MTDEKGQFSEQEIKQRMAERYRKQTDHELPQHVLDNYEEFFQIGPTMEDIEQIQEHERKRREELYSGTEVGVSVAVISLIVAVIAFLIGGLWFMSAMAAVEMTSYGFMALAFALGGFGLGVLLG